MSPEAWSTVASIGTFVVIAATAVAALLQLRHMRSSNQIAAVSEMTERLGSEKLMRARRFVAEELPKLLADPAGLKMFESPILSPQVEVVKDVGNFFEMMGAFVKLGIIDRALVCDLFDGEVYKSWKQLEPVTLISRRVGYSGTWASFEYLAVLCEKSLKEHQGDYYPRGTPRMKFDQKSIDAVKASRDSTSSLAE